VKTGCVWTWICRYAGRAVFGAFSANSEQAITATRVLVSLIVYGMKETYVTEPSPEG
jgi:hypothetical protein